MSETYVSVDIESDGPIPGPNSMLSFGAVAFDKKGSEISSFSANLDLLQGAVGNPDTMTWWATQPAAWAACRTNLQNPTAAMADFFAWATALPSPPVLVGYPVTFDFMFIHWYLHKFVGKTPFSHSALDIKTLAMVALNTEYRRATKRNMPKSWFPKSAPHTHVAVDDAREQGLLFFNILKSMGK